MPGYMTHSIMGEHVYKESVRTSAFEIPVDLKSMKTYSLGHDLSGLSKISSYTSHNQDTRVFFMEMLKYVKEHRLINDPIIMALLYGHMCHYFLDINVHPLVYYNELGLEKVSIVPNHTLVEGFIDRHQAAMYLKGKINSKYFMQGTINEECKTLLKALYKKVYHDPTYMLSLRLVTTAYSTLENVSRSCKDEVFIKISGFDKFLSMNHIDKEEFLNPNHDVWTQPMIGEKHTESFMDLYNRAIDMTLEAIKKVNEYLYGNRPLSSLESVFTNLSLDTGVDCSYGHDMKYVRRK